MSSIQTPATSGEYHDPDDAGARPPTPKPGVLKTTLLLLLGIGAVGGAYRLGWGPYQEKLNKIEERAERIRNAVPQVQVVRVRLAPAQTETTLPGDVQAIEETTVYARTTGYLKRWLVDIGDEVEAGQLLAEIDAPEVDQQLRQAQAELGQLKAKLKTATAASVLASATYDRYSNLVRSQSITPQEFDEKLASRDTTAAAVDAAMADVTAGEANVQRLTELQSFSKVYAPFSGTITRRSIDLGQLVTTGTNNAQPLFQISKTDPVRVFVHVPQIYAPGVKVGLNADLIVREYPGKQFSGEVSRTSRAIDPGTRTLLTEIHVPNPGNLLLTGSYVRVKLNITRQSPPIVVPASAVIVNADGSYVATVTESNHIHLYPVEVEGTLGSDVGLASGPPNDSIIVSNPGDRLKEGQLVQINMTEKAVVSGKSAPAGSTQTAKK
ncbi:efflux RND transporter periplasmic adaptor subunit [Planctomicrobium sp. SH527]|uniref:efflux RND transporter periplasmic adaptor subunit n=1 Tax=Planctomicrobium sp. SH527 TaxID=3448123 RepID=UPI003F5BEB84